MNTSASTITRAARTPTAGKKSSSQFDVTGSFDVGSEFSRAMALSESPFAAIA